MPKVRFLNCQVDVSKKVFKPREETEFWLGKTIKKAKSGKRKAKKIDVLDIFAGSGCIGIAVLKKIKNAKVDFADISEEAIKQIKINLKLNKILKNRYKIIKSNLFERLRGKKYDFIFANPPYVALKRIAEVQKEVLEREPHLALFAGKDGLDIIRKFLPGARKHLKPGGKLFMEFDPQQKKEIEKIAKKSGLKCRFKKDQFQKYRWLEG